MTPEELEEMEKSIPEWKRNALVMQGEEIKEDNQAFLENSKISLDKLMPPRNSKKVKNMRNCRERDKTSEKPLANLKKELKIHKIQQYKELCKQLI